MREVWKQVDGWPYEVSDIGRVRHVGGNPIKLRVRPTGYVSACLSNHGARRYVAVHRIVASAFIPNPNGKPEVNHKDGDRSNNDVRNLEWVTRSENERHAYRVLKKEPNRPWAGKPRRFARRFTDEQIRSIRDDSRPCSIIGSDYGVSKTTIQNIKKHKVYREVI